MPNAGALVLTAGARGAQGAQGASGAFAEPASLINGRQTGQVWVPVLPIRGRSVNLAEATFSGALSFGTRSGPSYTDTSQHLNLWNGVYGLNYYSGGPALVSQGSIDFWTTSGWAMSFHSGSNYRELWFSTDQWKIQWNTSAGDFIYWDYAGNPKFGYQGSSGVNRMVVWGPWQITSYLQHTNGEYGTMYDNIVAVGWKTTWDGVTIFMRLNNGSTDWGLVNACDERLKEDIAPSTYDCLGTVRKLRLYEFRWKDHRKPGYPKPAKPGTPLTRVGFIAQRLKEDFPEGMQQLAVKPRYDPGGIHGDTRLRNTDHNVMMALLCGAIQELDNEITRLEYTTAVTGNPA